MAEVQHKKIFLNDVCIIRNVLIIMLVLFHSFAIYSGGWESLEGQPSIPLYWWIGKISYSCFLEAFVFISGYTYYYNNRICNSTIRMEVSRKFKRLMIPCVVYGIMYFLLFGFENKNIPSIIYDIVFGVGHLWFLPMLFGCFMCTIVLTKLNISKPPIFGWFIILSILSFIPVPFRVHELMSYLFFFYIGFCFAPYKHKIIYSLSLQTITCVIILFILVFTAAHYSLYIPDNFVIDEKIFFYVIKRILRIFYSALGLILIYALTNYFLSKRRSSFEVPVSLKKMSGYCFGIYIYQQFVLKILYMFLPNYVPFEILPWLGFLLALIISTIMTALTLKLPFGKVLVG